MWVNTISPSPASRCQAGSGIAKEAGRFFLRREWHDIGVVAMN
jgi:hypothetical protein